MHDVGSTAAAVVPVRIETGGDQPAEITKPTASYFGAWLTQIQVRLALRWAGHAVRARLTEENPYRNVVESRVEHFEEGTRDLPGHGCLPLDHEAPRMYLYEALWAIVMAVLAFYVGARLLGFHPIQWETGHRLGWWVDRFSDTA